MFRTDFMPRSHNAALEQREGRFHGVGMDIAMGILARMVDCLVLVLVHLFERPRIDGRFVSHNHFDVAAHVGIDNLAHRIGLCIFGMNQAQIAIALPNPDDHFLFTFWPPSALLSADVGLVYLNSATKFLW